MRKRASRRVQTGRNLLVFRFERLHVSLGLLLVAAAMLGCFCFFLLCCQLFLPLVLVLLPSFPWAFLRLVGGARCDVSIFPWDFEAACQKSSIARGSPLDSVSWGAYSSFRNGRNGLQLFHNVLHFLLGCYICSGILRSWSYHGHASFFIMLAQHC